MQAKIKIKNNGVKQDAVLFNANETLLALNHGNSKDIEIITEGLTYKEILKLTQRKDVYVFIQDPNNPNGTCYLPIKSDTRMGLGMEAGAEITFDISIFSDYTN